jgi:dephospho-CoA kinase
VQAPPFIGLTGTVAAGKSAALDAFARLGAATLSTDAVSHELLDDAAVRDALAERWGPDVLVDGHVNRAKVAAIVFESPEELGWLESVLHPLVGRRVADWRESLPNDTSLAVVEVPLLFESGMEGAFDATVAVIADQRTRAARAGERGTALVEERSDRQLSQDEKAARATHVVRNDGSIEELDAEIARVAGTLRGGGPD